MKIEEVLRKAATQSWEGIMPFSYQATAYVMDAFPEIFSEALEANPTLPQVVFNKVFGFENEQMSHWRKRRLEAVRRKHGGAWQQVLLQNNTSLWVLLAKWKPMRYSTHNSANERAEIKRVAKIAERHLSHAQAQVDAHTKKLK